ncbi:class I SAM-dependent methyltransferase [Accumulibacter sp.]|uniref:class I SAM-dependent methyltransferase n=1 Tax=Accumulibacter sp. TaxID=2053492 RepID=UPI002637692F|nr:class I SAM-dependent methyltransferase [Accumulibacter sp.]
MPSDARPRTRDHDNAAVVQAPHPPLTEYYAGESRRRDWLRTVFDNSAIDYDRVERLLALGSGSWYRRRALLRAGLAPGMRVIDVGVGTGLVAYQAARIVGAASLVTGVDPSPGMLGRARLPAGVRLIEGRAEALPLPDACADFLSMGYALRHVGDLAAAFDEFRRVLKPGGIVCLLEITRPATRWGQRLLKSYMRGVVPALAWCVARHADTPRLMRYYWDTVEHCVPPERVICALERAGFADARRHVEAAIFSEYLAHRSA